METNSQINSQAPNNEEKLLSMLCHFSVFLGGVILPIVIWAIQKDKSKFIRFHALQSIFFHIAYVAIIIIFVIIFVVIIFLGVGVGISASSMTNTDAMPAFMIIFMILFYVILFGLIFGAIGYGVYVGVKAYGGNLTKYPIIGNIIYKKVYGTS